MLVWSPVFDEINDVLADDPLKFIIAPFIQKGALASLLEDIKVSDELEVITRWKSEDIASGVSDPEVFQFLSSNNYKLLIHGHIHLKLLITESNKCFVGSANITSTGLGLASNMNKEAGSWVELDSADEEKISELLTQSRLVTDEMYDLAVKYKKDTPPPLQRKEKLVFPEVEKPFTLGCLPAVETPQRFLELLDSQDFADDEEEHRYLHDKDLLEKHSRKDVIYRALPDDVFCRFPFQNMPIVKELCRDLEKEGMLPFGAVSPWIHDRCEDVPLPYRKEVKRVQKIFFNWLDFCIAEVSVKRPHHRDELHWFTN